MISQSEKRRDFQSEKVPPTIRYTTTYRMGEWFTRTHQQYLATEFPTMGSDWTRLSDSGNLQRYLSGQDSTITITELGGPDSLKNPDSTITRAVPVPPRSIVLMEDATARFRAKGHPWCIVSTPVEPEAHADGDGEDPI
jgi:hypothetical protein